MQNVFSLPRSTLRYRKKNDHLLSKVGVMETTLNRRKQVFIILIVLIIHFLLLLFFAVMQFKTPDTTALTHLIEQENMQPPAHEEDDGIELKAHDAFGGAPVIFQDEPEPLEQHQPEPEAAPEQDTPVIENQQDTTAQPEEIMPTEQLSEQEISEVSDPIEKTTTLETPPKPENKETTPQDKMQEQIKPKPPQEKQLTLTELAQGFLDHLKQQKEPYTMATQSDNQGAPSAEQLMYERYLQKIIQCIVKSYQTCASKPSSSTQPQEGIIRLSIKRDGSINALYVVESSGNRSVDAFALSLFRDASSSFPPAPERLSGNQHTVDFHFSDLRMFGSIMGWGLRSK